MNEKNKNILNWALLVLIILFAAFLRVYKINEIPAGIYPDEAVNGTDALGAIESGKYKLFYTNNYGREGLFMNLISLSIRVFGNTVVGLKFWSMLFGVLSVLGMFLLAREIFRSWRSGLIAAFFMASSFWVINFARISFRANMVPLILIFSFYFLLRGLRTNRYINYVLAGLIFGIGFHTYIAFRLAPAILVFFLLALIISRKHFFQNHWKPMVIFCASVLITLSPMIYDFIQYPEHFQSRSTSISVFSPEVNQGDLWGTLGKSLALSLVKYNFYGDQNWRHNFPPYPILNPLVGISFLVGIIYVIAKIFRLLHLRFRQKIYDDKLAIYLLLIGWFFAMLAPEFLTVEGLPHALRSIGTMPVVFILATIPVLWILGKSDQRSHFFRYSVVSLLIFSFLVIASSETIKYFYLWSQRPEQHGQFNANYKNMSLYLLSLPPETNKYVLANGSGREMEDGFAISAHVVKYLTHNKTQNLAYFKRDDSLAFKTPARIVLMAYDQSFIEEVKQNYPQAQVEKIDLNPGYPSDFTIISIN